MVFFVSFSFLFFVLNFRWESTLKFNCKIEELLKSVEAFLAEIKEKGLATNAKQVSIYPANWLVKKIPKVDYLITMATETDILEVLVTFIKKKNRIYRQWPCNISSTCWRCLFRSGITDDKSWNTLQNDGHKTGIS